MILGTCTSKEKGDVQDKKELAGELGPCSPDLWPSYGPDSGHCDE